SFFAAAFRPESDRVRFYFSVSRFAARFVVSASSGCLVFRPEIGSFGMPKTHERPNDERMDGRCSKCRKLLYV
ncbi:MAG: hypothetical protein K2N04_02580, partial [Alistipes sp.]|nr:hypothetical protein [Alistipes sp.]